MRPSHDLKSFQPTLVCVQKIPCVSGKGQTNTTQKTRQIPEMLTQKDISIIVGLINPSDCTNFKCLEELDSPPLFEKNNRNLTILYVGWFIRLQDFQRDQRTFLLNFG